MGEKARASYIEFNYIIEFWRANVGDVISKLKGLEEYGVYTRVVVTSLPGSRWKDVIMIISVGYCPITISEYTMSLLRKYLTELKERGAELREINIFLRKVFEQER